MNISLFFYTCNYSSAITDSASATNQLSNYNLVPWYCFSIQLKLMPKKNIQLTIDILETRSSPHKGTAIADITLKMITEMAYRW